MCVWGGMGVDVNECNLSGSNPDNEELPVTRREREEVEEETHESNRKT